MISKKMENMVANSSAIRAMFEEGNRLAKIYGPENVFDFSLGNWMKKMNWCFMDILTAMRDMKMFARL